MPAKKASSKNVVKVAAKKPSLKKKKPCPEIPADFFGPVEDWSDKMKKWAMEVDSCYKSTCGTTARRRKLLALCADFGKWAQEVKEWADDVEQCFQDECGGVGGPPGHTKPPPPPF